jgi:hypothetical protein
MMQRVRWLLMKITRGVGAIEDIKDLPGVRRHQAHAYAYVRPAYPMSRRSGQNSRF